MAKRATAALVALLLLVMPPATAPQSVSIRRTPRPTRPMRVEENAADAIVFDASTFEPGVVRPAGSQDIETPVPVIGGPETIRPYGADSHPEAPTTTPQLPVSTSTAPPTEPSSGTPPNGPAATTRPNVSQTGNKLSTSPSPPSLTTAPTPRGSPKQAEVEPPTPTVHQMPTSTPSITNTSPSPSVRGSVTLTPSPDSTTQPPRPQTPQAIESAIQRPEKTWPLTVFIAGIAAVASVIVVLLWKDTRFPKQRASHDGTTSMQNKTGSGELEYDWYASSPSLSSPQFSVDTFMGRQQVRMQSDPHVSSRAASTVDLLNVSTVGDRSTGSNSNRTASSQPIQEEQQADIESFHANVVEAIRSGETLRFESDGSSSPHVSFDDEVNALSNWSGSDTDASVQAIFDQHHRAFLRSQDSATSYAGGGSAAFSPTSTDGGDDFDSDENDSEDASYGESSSDGEDERASERQPRRYSNGSAYSAVPSFSTAILGDCSFVSSTRSDWSDLTISTIERESRQSIGSQDELV